MAALTPLARLVAIANNIIYTPMNKPADRNIFTAAMYASIITREEREIGLYTTQHSEYMEMRETLAAFIIAMHEAGDI